MLGFLILFQDATLSGLNHPMLRRFATLHTSCCLAFFIVMLLFSDRLIWDLVFTMLRCLIFSISCFTAWPEQLHVIRFRIKHILHAAWSWLHDARLLDLVCLMLSCLIFPASRHAVWSSPNMFDLTFMVPRCLMVSTSCYSTEPSQQDVMLLDGPFFMLW